jgi:hypothetical protein
VNVEALFVPDGDHTFVPDDGRRRAVAPRRPARRRRCAALFAGRLTPTDRLLGRLTVELLAPVPFAPLQLDISASEGGRRVQAATGDLDRGGARRRLRTVGDRPAGGSRPAGRGNGATPTRSLRSRSPSLTAADPALADVIGWETFHSTAVATRHLRSTG